MQGSGFRVQGAGFRVQVSGTLRARARASSTRAFRPAHPSNARALRTVQGLLTLLADPGQVRETHDGRARTVTIQSAVERIWHIQDSQGLDLQGKVVKPF